MFKTLYDRLLKLYGPQGWWPIHLSTSYPYPYHSSDYSIPKNDLESWEISLGAILTQNTAWTNVVKALHSLERADLFERHKLLAANPTDLAEAIRPAGYFNQKAGYLQNLARFLEEHSFSELASLHRAEARRMLLSVKGVGEETADSILLYALRHPSFVVDAYTRRLLTKLGWIQGKESYQRIQGLIERGLPSDLVLFQEYHALIVEHGKRHYSKRPHGEKDPLLQP